MATVGRNPAVGQVEIIDITVQALDKRWISRTSPRLDAGSSCRHGRRSRSSESELREVFVSGDSVKHSAQRQVRSDRPVHDLRFRSASERHSGRLWRRVSGRFFAGHAHGLTFARQLTNVETIRSERTFGQIVRGLQVYGRRVLGTRRSAQAIVTQVPVVRLPDALCDCLLGPGALLIAGGPKLLVRVNMPQFYRTVTGYVAQAG